jgi:hypothetical protein
MMQPIDFRQIKATVSMLRALQLVGWQPTWTRAELARGWCPLHSGTPHNSRIFCITTEGYYCWKCHAHGDVLDFWARHTGLPVVKAAEDLCARLHIPVPRLRPRR